MSEVFKTVHVSSEVKVLLLAMAAHMDEAGHFSVRREELAAMLGCHPRKVTEKQKNAIDAGLLTRTRAGSRGHTAEFQAEVPGVDRGPTVGTQTDEIGGRQSAPNRSDRGPTTSTLSDGERGPTTSTQSNVWGPTVGTQTARKGADSRPPTTYISATRDETADPVVAVEISDDKNDQKTKTLTASDRAPDPFDAFWAAYPRHIAKAAARKSFERAVKNGADPDAIIWGARAYASSPRRTESDIKYTAYPATWLNQERWDDEIEPAESTGRPAARPSARDQAFLEAQALREELFGTPDRPTLNIVRGELA